MTRRELPAGPEGTTEGGDPDAAHRTHRPERAEAGQAGATSRVASTTPSSGSPRARRTSSSPSRSAGTARRAPSASPAPSSARSRGASGAASCSSRASSWPASGPVAARARTRSPPDERLTTASFRPPGRLDGDPAGRPLAPPKTFTAKEIHHVPAHERRPRSRTNAGATERRTAEESTQELPADRPRSPHRALAAPASVTPTRHTGAPLEAGDVPTLTGSGVPRLRRPRGRRA